MLRFDQFRFDPATQELWASDVPVPLEPQPGVVLARLLASAGQTVSRDELAAVLWAPSGTHVNYEDGLNYCIRCIRRALNDAFPLSLCRTRFVSHSSPRSR